MEIYTTTFALSIWQIRGLTDDLLGKVRIIVNSGADDFLDKIASDAKKRQTKRNKTTTIK